jgi:uncharacterized membrane protein
MVALIWLSLVAAFLLIILLPLLFAQLMSASLLKLHLAPTSALLLVVAVILGGFVNIPIKRLRREATTVVHPLAVFGLYDVWPELRRVRRETVLAVNLGGCLIPLGLAVYELAYLLAVNARLLVAVAIASAINIALCYVLARPVPRVGIALPPLVPALVAASAALLLAPEQAPPIAFIAGTVGPLLGADLLHLKDIESIASGILSIGGAGTFDGIILSGIVAAYLA